jgi:hypothetical protein
VVSFIIVVWLFTGLNIDAICGGRFHSMPWMFVFVDSGSGLVFFVVIPGLGDVSTSVNFGA